MILLLSVRIPLLRNQRSQQMIEAIVIVGHFLVFQRESEDCFLFRDETRRPRNPILTRLLQTNHFPCFAGSFVQVRD